MSNFNNHTSQKQGELEEESKVEVQMPFVAKDQPSRKPFRKFKAKQQTASEMVEIEPDIAPAKNPYIVRVKRKRNQHALDQICKLNVSTSHWSIYRFGVRQGEWRFEEDQICL